MEEPSTHAEVIESHCPRCHAPLSSAAHVHRCLRDRLDAVRYVELFWDET